MKTFFFQSEAVGYAMYSADWHLLLNSSKISFVQIMRRGTKPIVFTASWVAPISIGTLTSVRTFSEISFDFLYDLKINYTIETNFSILILPNSANIILNLQFFEAKLVI